MNLGVAISEIGVRYTQILADTVAGGGRTGTKAAYGADDHLRLGFLRRHGWDECTRGRATWRGAETVSHRDENTGPFASLSLAARCELPSLGTPAGRNLGASCKEFVPRIRVG
ncbi:hypothetical protein NDU88_005454 [Pleurodeles waltl]|uniref:Uncharacterized protein n=1 Tax=Pleurodeles waltl TaxID=8319 RepID=A0AAV7TBN0_PLEWA|nr:hypothetical protein NDU88_005454 [Pleurodeles waltl]